MEEGAEQHRYVSQLRAEFDSCDAAAAGVLDRDGLTELCRRLQLEEQLPLLQDTLLGAHTCGRVTFEDFKDAFVAVLSRSLDLSTSEDDSSSYLEPVVPDEVKPKFVKGAKRYGRRSRPDSEPDAAETGDPTAPLPSARTEDGASSSPGGARRAKVRRSTSLDSVESLKSEDEAGSQKENVLLTLHNEGDQQEALERSDVRLQLSAEELLHHPSSHRVISGFSSAPISCSTPVRPAELQRMQLHCRQAQEEQHSVRSAGPTRLTATVGPRILSRLDDGTGCSSPERLMALWTEEGVRNSRDILQALDFPLEERLSLAELTLALDNELLVSGNGIHQAALVSYKNEIQHLQAQVEQALRQRDKLLQDLDLSDLRNLQLVREVDEHQASVESLNQSRIRELEQDYRDRLAALRWQAEQESEALLQQGELEGGALREELRLLRLQEAELREELGAAAQEGRRLEAELAVVKVKLSEAEASVSRLQGNLDQLLHDRFGAAATPSHEERFCDIIKGFERQCRDLRDRNDELSSEVELLKNQRSCRREQEADAPSWTEHQQATEFDSDESDMKCSSSPLSSRNLQPVDRAAPALSGPAVSIQTEMALEQLQQKHQRELKELHIQLETQVNYYERSLELMRQSMEVERKDISQAFKLEISELEEQKVEAEQRAKQLREAVDKLQSQQGAAAGGWSSDHERRMQRERAELEQNFAREIGNLVQRLSAEKAELEAELRLKMDQEVMAVRTQLEEVRLENGGLQERLKVLQQQVLTLEDDIDRKRRRLEELQREGVRSREEAELLQRENSRHRQEVLDLSTRNLELSSGNAELSARLHDHQGAVQKLEERLEEELSTQRDQLGRLSALEAELNGVTVRLQRCEEDRKERELEAQEQKNRVERLQQALHSLEEEAELLRSKLSTVNQEKLGHAQEVSCLQRELQDAEKKVEQLEASSRELLRQKEELHQVLETQQQQATVTQQEESRQLLLQNQELQQQLAELHKVVEEQQELRGRLSQVDSRRTQAEEQAARADAALTLARVQHVRQLQQLQETAGGNSEQQLKSLKVRLEEGQRKSQRLEEELQHQAQQSSSHISMKQEQYDKALSALQLRVEEVEAKLKGVRMVLQEKVQELKEQLAKNNSCSLLLKELYTENSQLQGALQVTEQRQKKAEKKSFLLEEKVVALNQLLRDVVRVSLAT
ncbi:ninein-like protein isoform X6 [Nelusetta ayraudi]|uniref:ninein-like protein isoform X6 n=1 Tax=Nelusetta ayraudi TaxID=303726 RepID=UPI003F72497D